MKSILWILAGMTLCYAGLCLLLYFFQDRLLFFPQKISEGYRQSLEKLFPGSEIQWKSREGEVLRGWWVKPEHWEKKPILLYFGGNAEEVSGNLGDNPLLQEASWVLVNYRGYGLSAGKPSAKSLKADALEIYDQVAKLPGVEPGRIFLFGRSLGAALALEVASHRPAAGLILVTPWDSLGALAKNHYPFFPVGWILKDPWDSVALAKKIRLPVLMLVGGRDSVIPPENSERLFQELPSQKQIQRISPAGHNDIQNYPEYWKAIQNFILR